MLIAPFQRLSKVTPGRIQLISVCASIAGSELMGGLETRQKKNTTKTCRARICPPPSLIAFGILSKSRLRSSYSAKQLESRSGLQRWPVLSFFCLGCSSRNQNIHTYIHTYIHAEKIGFGPGANSWYVPAAAICPERVRGSTIFCASMMHALLSFDDCPQGRAALA